MPTNSTDEQTPAARRDLLDRCGVIGLAVGWYAAGLFGGHRFSGTDYFGEYLCATPNCALGGVNEVGMFMLGFAFIAGPLIAVPVGWASRADGRRTLRAALVLSIFAVLIVAAGLAPQWYLPDGLG